MWTSTKLVEGKSSHHCTNPAQQTVLLWAYSECILSLTRARYAGWHVGQQQRYPAPVCSGPASERSPRCDGGSSSSSTVQCQVFLGRARFHFSSGVQWRAVWEMFPGPLLITCPIYMYLSPLHKDGFHAALVVAGEKMLVGDGLRQDSPKVLSMEDGQLVEIAFSHPPAFWAAQKDGKYVAWGQSSLGLGAGWLSHVV